MRLIYLVLFLVTVVSCNKVICKDSNDKQSCSEAIVKWLGAPEADGLGWVLRLPDDKIKKPSNLGEEYKIDGLTVNVCYEATDDKFSCFCAVGFINMVKIISISK
jgi:hypothetical protein